MSNEYWITNSRFKFIALLLFLMFLIFMVVIYLKADEVTRNPCAICAEKMGKQVTCSIGISNPLTRTFDPNGTIYDSDGIKIHLNPDG